MRILFDQGTPVPISGFLTGHVISISADLGWDQLRNGELLAVAERSGFELLLTTDKNLRYQQDLAERSIAIVVIGHAQWPSLKPHVHRVVEAINQAAPGSYAEVEIPLPPKKPFLRS
jgi:hypothetical protein